MAPGAQIYAYKVLNSFGSGSTPNIIAAVERCADPNGDADPSDHLDVCSLSLGGSGDPDDATSTAVDNATASGVVFTIAAGNAGPAASTIGSPGTSRRAITVAAACKPEAIGVDSRCDTAVASFSSRGPVVWNGQTLAKPDVSAPGVSICATEWGSYDSAARCLDSRHVSLSGTSMATPHVAGVAALLRQAHPEWTPDQVKTFIVDGAHTFGLDPSIEGSGMIDAMGSLELGGLPSQIALVSGTPLRDLDVPTTRFATFSSDLTITNETSGTVMFTGSFAGDTGLAVTLTPSTFTLDAGAAATVTVARTVDNDVVASGADARGTITFSSAQGHVDVGLEVGVRPRLSATPSPDDLGVDLATLGTWTGQSTLSLTNLRTDVAQTYTATIHCCDSVTQPGGSSVVASLDQSSITIGPGGSASLGVTVNATNGPLANGRYDGSVTLTSSLGALTVPVTFFKGYGIRVNTTATASALALSSDLATPSTFYAVDPSMTFYSTTAGPYYVEAVWPSGPSNSHVFAVVNTDVPLATVTLDPSQAVYTFSVHPTDQNGAELTTNLLYRFTHASTGGGVIKVIAIGNLDPIPIHVSAVPAGIEFTAAAVGVSGDPLGYLYELSGPVAADQTFTNTPADLVTKDIRLFRPGVGSNAPFFLPTACLPWLPWGPPGPGGNIGSVQTTCIGGAGVLLPSGTGQMRFYNSANRDLLAASYPDAPSISFQVQDGSAWGAYLYFGPELYVSTTHPLTWSMIAPWYGTARANEVYALSKCDEAPGNVLAIAPGPLDDQWSWWNHSTDFSWVRSRRGGFKNPFAWGGCVQDEDYQGLPVSYQLFRDEVLVQSATIAVNSPLEPTLTDGQYRFVMSRAPVIAGVTTQAQTVSTFSVSSVASIDENPPALRSVHLVGRERWQDVLDPAVINRLRFNVDPIPGFGDANPYTALPPLFAPLADSVTIARAQRSADGSAWKDVAVTALGNGDYQTDAIDVDPAATLTWFRVSATDQAGNTLSYTFQVPRGTADSASGTDTVAPTTSITEPSAGSTLSGVVTVTAVAADDVGVTEVDLLVDGVKVAASAASPYTFNLDTSLVAPGSHVLQTRAQDAAENAGYSATVSVTTQSADTTAPVVALIAPAAGALVHGTVVVSASASDDHQVARVELYDGSTLIAAPTSAPYSVSWDTTPAAAGAHTLRAVAYDAAGNSATATESVTLDNTPPTVSLSAPANGATVAGTVTVSASASDATAVAHVDFYDGATSIGTATSAPYTASWNTSAIPLGAHSLKARAYDTAGNFADSATISVTVASDLTPPTVSFIYPTEGRCIGTYNNISIAATDNVGVVGGDFYDGSTLVTTFNNNSPPYGWNYTTTNVPDGPHTFLAHAWDAANNIATSAPLHVTIDKVPPTVAITSPANNAHVSDNVTITTTYSDNCAPGPAYFYDGNTQIATVAGAPYTATWDTLTWADGWHYIEMIATDQAQNYASPSIALYVDNSVSPHVSSPTAGALVGRTVPITATTNNDGAVASMTFYDGTTAIGSKTSAPWTITWNPTTAGTHSLTVRTTDLQNRVATSPAVSVTADIVAPTVAVTAPANGATVAGTVTVSATASDNTAVARVEFYDGPTLIATATTAPYGTAWNTSAGSLGAHTLMARAYDTAGNGTDSATISVTVVSDLTPPTVSITSPTNGTLASTSVSWTVTAGDNVGVTSVQLFDGSTLLTTLTTSPYAYTWNTTGATAGSHSLTARAFDAAGNSATSAAVSITIDHTAPTTSLTAPSNGATVQNSVNVTATASDNVAVAHVDFYRDGTTLLGTDATSSYSISWDTTKTAAGSHSLTAVAYDTAGNATTSAARSVTVKDVTAPTVSITSPATNTQVAVGSVVQITATASDATGVAKVQFLVSNTVTCTVTAAPWVCNWTVPSVTNKNYSLVAKAYDAANNNRSSATVSVTSH